MLRILQADEGQKPGKLSDWSRHGPEEHLRFR